jgi:hypothetical protein
LGGTSAGHVDEILNIMEEESLFSKEEKCEFGLTKILYLGHVIGVERVKVHQEKIQISYIGPPLDLSHSCEDYLGYAAIIDAL